MKLSLRTVAPVKTPLVAPRAGDGAPSDRDVTRAPAKDARRALAE